MGTRHWASVGVMAVVALAEFKDQRKTQTYNQAFTMGMISAKYHSFNK